MPYNVYSLLPPTTPETRGWPEWKGSEVVTKDQSERCHTHTLSSFLGTYIAEKATHSNFSERLLVYRKKAVEFLIDSYPNEGPMIR